MENLSQDLDFGDNEVVEVSNDGAVWPEKVEQYFIDLMEEEVKKGNRNTTTFKKNAWNRIRDEMKKKTKRDYTNVQVKNKFNGLRSRWKNFKKLISETGIRYNSITGQVIASEDVWKKLYEVNRMARRFKKHGCKEYEKLCVIYGDTTATGCHAHPSTKSPSISEDEEFNKEGSNSSNNDDTGHKDKKAKNVGTSRRRAREEFQTAMAQALTTLGENSRKKIELMEKRLNLGISSTSVGETGKSCGGHQTIEVQESILNCLDKLNALEDIDGASYAKATKFLHNDPLWRTMFLAMPDERKKDWVLNI